MSSVTAKAPVAPTAEADTATPTRARPFGKTRKRAPRWMRKLLGRDPSPTREEYDRLVAALQEGDPPMDALLDWMYQVGMSQARPLFERALEQGIDAVPDAPDPLKTFFADMEREPEWLDRDLLDQGVRFIHRTGLAGPFILRDFALMGGYLLSGFNHTLVLTGALHKGAAKRMAETGKWWMDCTEPDGLQRFGAGFRTTVRVRMVHALVRRNLPNRPEWDNAKWGLPVNQVDMAATYLAFCVVMLFGVRALGVPVTRADSLAVMHLWKYACWLMGVDEEWLVDTERDGLVLLYQTWMTQSPPDWTSRELGRALAEEPLHRRYPWHDRFPRLHSLFLHVLYHQHLSTSALFLNRRQREQLGLPRRVLPWYPALTAGPRFLRHLHGALSDRARRELEEKGRRAQRMVINGMFGKQQHGIIQPASDHPAFVPGAPDVETPPN